MGRRGRRVRSGSKPSKALRRFSASLMAAKKAATSPRTAVGAARLPGISEGGRHNRAVKIASTRRDRRRHDERGR
jgi:hypothetical protein